MTFSVTLDRCHILSILVQRETQIGQITSRRQLGDVWRTTDGFPLSARAFLTVSSRRELGAQLARQLPGCTPRLLLRRFDPHRFYLTEAQIHLYYPAGLLPDSGGEIRTVSLPLTAGPVQFS